MTVGELCDLYIAEGCEAKRKSTLSTDTGRIERHVKPLIGQRRVGEVMRADIERFLRDVAIGKTKADVRTGPRGRAIVEGGKGTASERSDCLVVYFRLLSLAAFGAIILCVVLSVTRIAKISGFYRRSNLPILVPICMISK